MALQLLREQPFVDAIVAVGFGRGGYMICTIVRVHALSFINLVQSFEREGANKRVLAKSRSRAKREPHGLLQFTLWYAGRVDGPQRSPHRCLNAREIEDAVRAVTEAREISASRI